MSKIKSKYRSMHEFFLTFTGISKIAKFLLNLSVGKSPFWLHHKIYQKKNKLMTREAFCFFPPRIHDTRGRPCNHLEDVG